MYGDLYKYYAPQRSFRQVVPAEQSGKSEIPAAFWIDESSFVFTLPSDQLSDIERGGGVSGDIYERHAAPLVLRIFELDGLLYEGASEEQDLIDYTASILVQARMPTASSGIMGR